MAEFSMKIAGRVGRVTTQFDSTQSYCRNYLTEDPPDFSATVTAEDRTFEQEASWEEARIEGFRPRRYTDPHLERAALQRVFAENLFRFDTLLFHGSLVAVDGKGYLFTAKSGTGKSTHTRLWREVLGERASMVNDDKPFLHIRDGVVTAYGTPWNGKHRLGANISMPLKAVCILERGVENCIQAITAQEALPMVFQQSHRPGDPRRLGKYLELVDGLARSVAFYRLHCNMDPQAAMVAYEGMNR